MIKVKHILFLLFPGLLLSGCFPVENFSDVPRIGFNSLEFKENPVGADSLVLTIDFQDGDGDLGLLRDETNPPYHPFDWIISGDLQRVTISNNLSGPFFLLSPIGGQSFFSNQDERPDEFNCIDYEVTRLEPGAPIDTFFVKRNPNNKNIFIDFYRKVNGQYQFIDWASVNAVNSCGITYDARFPIFDEKSIGRSLEGSIRYGMQSSGFRIVLRSDTFQLRVSIKDRALNQSNTIRTPDFTLSDILTN